MHRTVKTVLARKISPRELDLHVTTCRPDIRTQAAAMITTKGRIPMAAIRDDVARVDVDRAQDERGEPAR